MTITTGSVPKALQGDRRMGKRLAQHNDGGQAFPDNANAFGPPLKSVPDVSVEFRPFPKGPMVAGPPPPGEEPYSDANKRRYPSFTHK